MTNGDDLEPFVATIWFGDQLGAGWINVLDSSENPLRRDCEGED